MQCPDCKSEQIRKNGKNRQGKQNYICVNCSRQFIENYEAHREPPPYCEAKRKQPPLASRPWRPGGGMTWGVRGDPRYSDEFKRSCLKM